ncbi:hypothetical protein [Chryseobacterium sp.]|uniref:hypothetical protein n=1 Tax=Chryseobacterium sp. TaxID=1871047 RepID=UPI0025BB219D|nr:hypothetical protein [Chryseobacterium sp.]MBV8326509.1 hypothetical protein [Chryseobacterium sp.]
MNNKSSIYISTFKRKGGEGLKTKIITDTNRKQYESLFVELGDNENPLIVYFENIQNWVLFTDLRILFSNEGVDAFFNISDIIEVTPAIEEEFKNKVMNKEEFTRLKVKTRNSDYFICKLEPGLPYQGFYQMLHFIKTKNTDPN